MKKLATLIVLLTLSFHALAINPVREYSVRPEQLGLKYQAKKINVTSTVELNSWIFLQDNENKPFIIVSNSDAGNMSNCLGQASEFFKAGFNVILYDYRGFGESTDFEINRNMMYYEEFSEDLRSVLHFVRKVYAPKKVVLYGLSMGTIISKSVLNNDASINGAILDSFVIDPNLVVSRILEIKNKHILLPDAAQRYMESNRKTSSTPILLFSGLKDIITKSTDYSEFIELNGKSRLVTWDCNHLECFFKMTKDNDSDIYMSEVNKYIESLI
ncbi:alpha/beta fold hydrolase [Pedobacter sp. N36a]|uniref:alpha/beta hydrolase n=1 Tax=Pedobacter sp. N36a TaxID=2767996 RepID=UPI00165738C9|nr:alpha/beta fold hydrolase [Pedobacter sp. N36a]MBC8986548.1 alpha/beta fold hydrolase [Pedobacter sp. N36a]